MPLSSNKNDFIIKHHDSIFQHEVYIIMQIIYLHDPHWTLASESKVGGTTQRRL